LGIPSLTPERSRGYSAGITSQPAPRTEITIDAYHIKVDNRVGNTGNFSATDANLPEDLRALLLQTGTTQAKFFYNAFSTRTKGIEFTGSYKLLLDKASLSLLAGANFSENEVASVNTPKGLEAYRYIILSEAERARVTTNIPAHKITLQGVYSSRKWDLLLRTVYFGAITTATALNATFPRPDYFFQQLKPIWVTDLSAGYHITPQLQASIGVNNVFDVLGDYTAPAIAGLRNPTVVGMQNGSAGIQPFARLQAKF
jgi:iron complex outermembrane receptor protein